MSSPNKSCSLDPAPTKLVKLCIDGLTPLITDIVNASLNSGIFPDDAKNALITPLLKKPSLDAEVLANYRPVSNVTFLSKVLERVVASRLKSFFVENSHYEKYQSAYREFHSTESALLKIREDIITSIGNRKAVLLVLLDLSSAFDTINHDKLICILRRQGIRGVVLDWFSSYLSNRKQRVVCTGATSSAFPLKTGVPQGSVLGPVLFTAYTSSLGCVLKDMGVGYHFYADDTQIYLSFDTAEEVNASQNMERCVQTVRDWMRLHELKMNDAKTELIYLSNRRQQLHKRSIMVGDQAIIPKNAVRNIGVFLDDGFTMERHVLCQSRNAFIALRSLSRIKQHLSPKCIETLIHAFISSKIDYCNSLYLGVPHCIIDKLQRVQNAAARLITGGRKHDRITPILYKLHWLPVCQRIKFKVLLTVYKAKHGMCPAYISDLIQDHTPSRALRSSDVALLSVPFTRSSYVKERSFAFAAPKLWNSLPLEIRNCNSMNSFKSNLKTFLFKEHFCNGTNFISQYDLV